MKKLIPILLGLTVVYLLYCMLWPLPPEKSVRIILRSDGAYIIECRYSGVWMDHTTTATTNLDQARKHRDWFVQHRRAMNAEEKLTRKVIE